MSSQHKQIRDEIVTACKAATLTGITSVTPKRVYRRKFPWYRDDLALLLPCLTVCYLPEVIANRVNNKNDFDYRFQLTLLRALEAPELADESDESDVVVVWRETLMDLFRGEHIPAGSLSYRVTIEPGPIFDETSHRNKIDASAFVLHCWRRR